jgi:alkylation response protein AidB-like acyl-CoA dehydrogenase
VRLAPTEDDLQLRSAVHDVLAKECPPQVVRDAWNGEFNSKLWSTLGKLGFLGLTVPEELGGSGMDERSAVGVLIEAGRVALPSPVVESFAAVALLRAIGPSTQLAAEWLPRIAHGDALVAISTPESPYVVGADNADLLLLTRGDEIHAVPPADVALTGQESMDGTRHLFSVDWQPGTGTLVAEAATGRAAITRARRVLVLGTAAELVGLARTLLEMSTHHVRVREQFGRPLGTFQAVQHRLVDVLLAVEFAGPVLDRAAWTTALDLPTAERDVSMAKVLASHAGERAAYSALQVHGAIGYTREHDLHLFLMRAWTLAAAYGDASRHRQRVACSLKNAGTVIRFP